MVSSLRPVVAAFARHLDQSAALGILVILQTVFFSLVALLAGRFGSPRTWPRGVFAATTGLGFGAAVIWLWIDRNVEGSVLFAFSEHHGATTGDLLAVPMVAVSAILIAFRLRPRTPS
jgi:hypothetical protein